ncbi:MAG: response regulator [Anaerolineae bacterium]|nr:response regulator [Anaerolineae bacterium]
MKNHIRILLVEDEFMIATLLSRNLERFFGYEVVAMVATGEEAVEKVKTHQPDVILLDIHLASAMTGIEAAQKIRNTATIPIIFVTGYTSAENMATCLQIESTMILEKPLGPDEVHAAIQKLFKQDLET